MENSSPDTRSVYLGGKSQGVDDRRLGIIFASPEIVQLVSSRVLEALRLDLRVGPLEASLFGRKFRNAEQADLAVGLEIIDFDGTGYVRSSLRNAHEAIYAMGHLQTQSVYSIRQSCGYEQISSIIDMAPDPTEYEDHSEQSGDLRHGRLPLEGHTAKGF